MILALHAFLGGPLTSPGASRGIDVCPDGQGTVTDQKLYQLIRQMDGVDEHTFAIEFLDSRVHAYAFTFG
jgi:hypothetical protein